MRPHRHRTCYASLSRRQALAILAALLAGCDWCFLQCDPRDLETTNRLMSLNDDARLYSSITRRVHNGESYYAAAASELSSRSYPLRSVFNWRSPIYAWVFGTLPDPRWGRAALLICTVITMGIAGSICIREGGPVVGVLFLLVAIAAQGWLAEPQRMYFTEVWCGSLLLLALSCQYYNVWGMSVLLGSVALAVRELALPFCATALVVAWWRGRTRELAAWLVGITICAGLYVLHWIAVGRRNQEVTVTHDLGWITFGGMPFLLSTCRVNFLLTVLPNWCTSVYLPLSMVGLIGLKLRSALTIKATALVYIGFFLLVGKLVDFYWGWVVMPILVFGLAWSPVSLIELIRSAIRDPTSTPGLQEIAP